MLSGTRMGERWRYSFVKDFVCDTFWHVLQVDDSIVMVD
jgi:hypothetical protein